MGDIADKGNLAWRDYVVDGVPSSGDRKPPKTEIRDFVAEVDSKFETLEVGNGTGLLTFATTSARNAFVHSVGTTGVTGQDLQDGNFYRSSGSAWVLIGASPAVRLTTAEANIVALDGRLDAAETNVTSLQAADTALDARLDIVEAASAATHAEAITDPSLSEIASMWSSSVVGDPSGRAAISAGDITTTTIDGRMIRVTGAVVRAAVAAYRLLPGHKYEVLAGARRITDPTDPSGDSVSLRAQWLDGGKTAISQVSLEDFDLVSTNGLHLFRAVIALAEGDEVQVVAPANAVYFTPLVRTWGTDGVTDILPLIRVTDLTSNTLISADTAGMNTRIASLESLDIGDRLTSLESAAATNVRVPLTTTTQLYVSPTGNDSNDGRTSADDHAFKTLNGAMNYIQKRLDNSQQGIQVNAAPGTYAPLQAFGSVTGQGYRNGPPIAWVGDRTTPSNVIIATSTGACVEAQYFCNMSFEGFQLQPSTLNAYGFRVSRYGLIQIGSVEVVMGGCQDMLIANSMSNVQFIGGIQVSGTGNSCFHSTQRSIVLCSQQITFVGTPVFANYAWGCNDATLSLNAATITGAFTGGTLIHFNSIFDVRGLTGSILGGSHPVIDISSSMIYDDNDTVPGQPREIYVRQDGSNLGQGLYNTAADAFTTVNAALIELQKWPFDPLRSLVRVNVADYLVTGTPTAYPNQQLNLLNMPGNPLVRIQGNVVTPGNVIIANNNDVIRAQYLSTKYDISGVTLQATGGGALVSASGPGTRVDLRTWKCGATTGGTQLFANEGAQISLQTSYEITGGGARHILARSGGAVIYAAATVTLTGTPAFSTAFAEVGQGGFASIPTGSVTFSGSATGKRFVQDLSTGGLLWTNSATASYLPGDVAGTVTAPVPFFGLPNVRTSDYTVSAADIIVVNGKSASSLTLTLPAAADNSGRALMIMTNFAQTTVSASSNVVPLGGGSAGTAILSANVGRWCTLVSNGTNWVIVAGVI